ncbi:Hypothetical protein A7982_09246 [Minicystis rosea]|nr:Hypothetical protein A7982_09246 [Minicystis rosea]
MFGIKLGIAPPAGKIHRCADRFLSLGRHSVESHGTPETKADRRASKGLAKAELGRNSELRLAPCARQPAGLDAA